MLHIHGSPDHDPLQLLVNDGGTGLGSMRSQRRPPPFVGVASWPFHPSNGQVLEGAVERVQGLRLEAVWCSLHMPDVKNNAGVFLGHSDQTEVVRRVLGRKKAHKGVVFEEREGAPGFEEGEEACGGDTTLE